MDDETGGEGWARYRKLQGAGGLFKNSDTYVRFSVKFPHLQRRHDLAPRPLTGRQRIFNHRTRIIPAALQPLLTGGTNAQGVDQISNGVSVLNLGQGHSSVVANPNPAAPATSSSSSSSGNNNY